MQRCAAPNGFAATREYGGAVSWIELRLVDDERWVQYGPGAVGMRWDLALMGLTGHLGSGKTVDPSEAAAWSASDEGRQFMTLSSQAWAEASIAAGTDPAMARAAADRTTAFYTGTPVA